MLLNLNNVRAQIANFLREKAHREGVKVKGASVLKDYRAIIDMTLA